MKTLAERLLAMSNQAGGLWDEQRALLREAATAISDLRRQMADAIEEGVASRLVDAARAEGASETELLDKIRALYKPLRDDQLYAAIERAWCAKANEEGFARLADKRLDEANQQLRVAEARAARYREALERVRQLAQEMRDSPASMGIDDVDRLIELHERADAALKEPIEESKEQ